MNPNLQRLISNEANYQKYIKQLIDMIKNDSNFEGTFKKIILFWNYVFSVNFAQHKKFLCLMLIKDISQSIKSEEFQRILDQKIPIKLLKTLRQQISNQGKESRHQDDQKEYSDKVIRFAVQTISFWSKKLSFLPGKSHFGQAYQELKKMKVDLPKNYEFYKSQKLSLGLWGDRQENSEQFLKNEEVSPLIGELSAKFNECKSHIEQRINEGVINEEEIYLKSITQKLRDFLLSFFGKYKQLQNEVSIDRDVLVVYFHIINTLFKRISNKFFLPVQELITMTKQIFQGNHSADFSSIDRMDIVHLSGIHKYNALSIFQRIHKRIQAQEQKLGPCQLSFEQKDFRASANKMSMSRQKLQNIEQKKPRFKR